jgi:hypothetical protein
MQLSRLAAAGVTLAVTVGLTTTAYGLSGHASGATKPGSPAVASDVGSGAPPGLPGASGSLATAAQPQLPSSSTVTLITGDRARLDVAPNGEQSATMVPGANGEAEAVGFSWAGDQYLVPDDAVAGLGSVLDPRLFDVSYLARAKLGGTLPVQISYTGATVPALPGVQISHAADGVASGTISAAQTPRLGAMLESALRPHAAAAGPAVAALGGVTRISLAQAAGAPPLPPDPLQPLALGEGQPGNTGRGVAFHTIHLKFLDTNGKPALALGFVQNADDALLSPGLQLNTGYPIDGFEIQDGYSLSVPDGSYSLEFAVLTPDSATYDGYDSALVVEPQVTVDSDETITLDARAAVPYHVTITGTKAPPGEAQTLGFTRTSAANGESGELGLGGALSMDLISETGAGQTTVDTKLRATPTPVVTKGTFGFDAYATFTPSWTFQSPDPSYALDFPHLGSIPASLNYTVPGADLTTVHERVYDSASGACSGQPVPQVFPYIYWPWGDIAADGFGMYATPGVRTDYWYTSDPRLDRWQEAFNADDCTRRFGAIQMLQPGGQISDTWNQAPLVPSPTAPLDWIQSPIVTNWQTSLTMAALCGACRQGDIGAWFNSTLGDSDPSHYTWDNEGFGNPDALSSSLQFWRNGTLADVVDSQANNFLLSYDLQLLPRPAVYRLEVTTPAPDDPAGYTETDWTFRSSPDDPAARLPRGELCAPDTAAACSFLPLLFPVYNLPLNLSDQATAGAPFTIRFTVSHQLGESPPSGVTATVSESFDDGKTWTAPQAATGTGGGQFSATIAQPALSATSGFASLRVTARDAAGDSVTQTIVRAYGLTS